MFYNQAFPIMFIVSICLVANIIADNLPNNHRKRELIFNNYPASRSAVNERTYQNFQGNDINDPGYTTQHESTADKPILSESYTNLTSPKYPAEFSNSPAQMLHFMYMPSRTNNPQQLPLHRDDREVYQNYQNLAYVGPQRFPAQMPNPYAEIQQFNLPFRNLITQFTNAYPAHLQLRPQHQNQVKDSKVSTKMEAPFMPSQFLGYTTPQNYNNQLLGQYQQLLRQNQQLAQLYQKMPQQGQLFHPQQQQSPHTAPVQEQQQEQQEDTSYPFSNLIYMAPKSQ